MKFNIRSYIWEIFEIRKYYNLSNIKLAFNMFMANIKLGYERYHGSSRENYSILSRKYYRLPNKNKDKVRSTFKK